jgi:hypothetical protein
MELLMRQGLQVLGTAFSGPVSGFFIVHAGYGPSTQSRANDSSSINPAPRNLSNVSAIASCAVPDRRNRVRISLSLRGRYERRRSADSSAW